MLTRRTDIDGALKNLSSLPFVRGVRFFLAAKDPGRADAFLLGLDMRALANSHDARFVDQFLGRLLVQDEEGRFDDVSDSGVRSFRGQIHAFRKGYTGQ